MWQQKDNLTKLDDEQDNLTKISQSSLFRSELNVWIWVQQKYVLQKVFTKIGNPSNDPITL